jgi:hypothetical protein
MKYSNISKGLTSARHDCLRNPNHGRASLPETPEMTPQSNPSAAPFTADPSGTLPGVWILPANLERTSLRL